jgi:Sec-independent protein translocase protein TatA
VAKETPAEGEGDEAPAEAEPSTDLPTLQDTTTHIQGPAEWVIKELQRRHSAKTESMTLPNFQHDITQNIRRFKKQQKKHELKHQIKNMHLRENALLKNEMQEKLQELDKLEEELDSEDLVVRNKLGLVGDKDVRKKNFKERLHVDEEEEKKAKEAAEKRVEEWEAKMKERKDKQKQKEKIKAEKAKALAEKLEEE